MAKLVRRRRRRRPRRPHEGEASGAAIAHSGPIKSALQAGRRGLSASGKAQEAEADRIADHALANGPKASPMRPASAPATPRVQAKLSPTATGGGAARPKGPAAGKPLSAKLRNRFSGPLGSGLGSVRIDTSASAAQETHAMGASAVTTGQTISFASGAFAPDTPSGAHLLAHELAHTVQQKQAGRAQPQAKPAAKAAKPPIAKHGFPQIDGGLINDSARRRMNVIVRKGDSLLSIAARLVRYWVASEADLSPGARASINPAIRTAEGMAKALLVYHRTYLVPPAMANWREGLRLPLPMLVPKDGSPPLVNAPLAGLWVNGFKPTWSMALRKKAGIATPQTTLSQEDTAFLHNVPEGLGGLLANKAIRNAKEALPLIRTKLQPANITAGLLALGFLENLTNIQVAVLAGQPEGQDIIALIRAAILGNKAALTVQNKAGTARAMNMLGKTSAAFSPQTVAALQSAYKTQSGNHCMTACYMGIGQLYGEDVAKNVDSEVRRKDRADQKRDLKSVVTMMETLQEMGRAGAPQVFIQKTVDTGFDKDPDAFIQAEVAKYKSQPGVYFYGLSVVTGYHTVMLALDLTQPDAPRLVWLDQHRSSLKMAVYGELTKVLKGYAQTAVENAMLRGKTYSPLRSKIWPLYPPSSLIMPLD